MMTIDEYINGVISLNMFDDDETITDDDETITGFGISVIDETGKETIMKGVLEYPFLLEFWDGKDAITIGYKTQKMYHEFDENDDDDDDDEYEEW